MVGSDFVTDTATSLDAFINASADELYDLLTLKFDDYNVSSAGFTTDGGTTVALPADFYKLLGVDLSVGGREQPLSQFTFKERHRYQAADVARNGLPLYRLEGSVLRLRPAPASGLSGTIWYTPTRAQLVAGSDAMAGVSGWEEYVVVDSAIKCLAKEESDTTTLERKLAGLKQRIEEAAAVRAPAEPAKIVDVEDLDGW
jgi:hypothetical protein